MLCGNNKKVSATVEHWLFDLHTLRVAAKGILVATRKGNLVTISLYSDKRALQFDFPAPNGADDSLKTAVLSMQLISFINSPNEEGDGGCDGARET